MLPLLQETGIIKSISDDELKSAIISVKEDIENHDASKYSEEEFEPYRIKYYPTTNEKNADEETRKLIDFNSEEAWKHHYKTNDHHPMFWADSENNSPRDMSLGAIIHMLCDWEAMSYKFGTSTLDWYNNKASKEKEAMTDRTKVIVEELLDRLFVK